MDAYAKNVFDNNLYVDIRGSQMSTIHSPTSSSEHGGKRLRVASIMVTAMFLNAKIYPTDHGILMQPY